MEDKNYRFIWRIKMVKVNNALRGIERGKIVHILLVDETRNVVKLETWKDDLESKRFMFDLKE